MLRHEVLLLSGVASACHFYAGIHGERHVGVCRENALVIEHAAHVAVDAHFHLFAFRQALGEISGDAHDAVSFAVFYAALGFSHVCTIVDDFYVGRRVNVAQVFAAHCRMAFVDHGNGHFPHHFISIDETIEQRIGQRNEKEEDQDTFVFHDVFQFELEQVVPVGTGLLPILLYFFFHAVKEYKEQPATSSSSGATAKAGATQTRAGPPHRGRHS